MNLSDVAAKVLRLSAISATAAEFLAASLSEICSSARITSAAILQPTPPTWTNLACCRLPAGFAPADVAAEALEQGRPIRHGDWWAVPLTIVTPGDSVRQAPTDVLLLRTDVDASDIQELCDAFQTALTAIRQQEACARRARRLEKILEITHEWHQTDEMEVLLTRMAQTATELIGADRASIFLWDKPSKTLVGRPALGIEGGELRIADDAGVVGQVVQTGEARRVSAEHSDEDIDRRVDQQTGYHTESLLCVPLVAPDGERVGAFEVLNKKGGVFTSEDERGLQELSRYAAIALANTQQVQALLVRNEQLVEQAAQTVQFVGQSPQIEALRRTVQRVADTDLAILILGENGTGKEVVARSLHYLSRRRSEPFVAVNCAALTETLLESELFGHEKGAFTDAHETRVGKFELAAGGTLFLDEIGDMSLGGQAKLLRVLEEKKVTRVGGSASIHTEVRVLAATNQNLAELVRAKKFREDLYFRLNVVTLELPPLRERGDDVMLLAESFLSSFCRNVGRRRPVFTAAARKRLLGHAWPGNVRELRNLMERLAYLSTEEKIDADDLAFILSPGARPTSLLDVDATLTEATRQFQEAFIRKIVDRTRGNVSEAAKRLGVHRSNLYRKMRQLGMLSEEDDE